MALPEREVCSAGVPDREELKAVDGPAIEQKIEEDIEEETAALSARGCWQDVLAVVRHHNLGTISP